MTGLPHDIDAALARVAARRGPFGAPVVYLAETGSTNDVAAGLAARGAGEGTTVLAGAQTRGRGRLGRSWVSPAGAGVYLSVVIRPSSGAEADTARLLTLAGGVAVAEGIRAATGLPVELKWPNDVVVGRPRRKLAGILAEGSTVADRIEYVVLGVGINLSAAAYPPDLAGHASSLEVELGRMVDRAAVVAETLAALGERYADLREGRARAVQDRWRRLAPSAEGSPVEWTSRGDARAGTAAGIDDDGALLVRGVEGLERIVAGEVRWV
jgi:BirA family biotin operon repressor/biotin-[acetyl-CoA-carboxylase] ligase